MPPAAQPRNAPHPPLAHDGRGIPLAVPEGAIAWRVRRQTAGRPKVVVGPDRQALRLPLDTSAADLLDLCGAGTYRLDAIDEGGQLIDFVTTVTVGGEGLESSSEAEPLAPIVVGGRGNGSSDLRFALETIAHLARANSEALRSTTAAQADWIKGLAQAKALHRNAVVFASPSSPHNDEEEDEDDDEEQDDDGEDGDAGRDPMAGVNTMLGHVADIAKQVGPMFVRENPRNAAPTETPSAPAETPAAEEVPAELVRNGNPSPDATDRALHIVAILDRLSPDARRIARRLLAGKTTKARELASALADLSVKQAVAELEKLAEAVARDREASEAPPTGPPRDLAAQLAAVRALLTPIEVAQVMALMGTIEPATLETFKARLLAMTPEDAATWVRAQLAAHGKGGTDAAR